MGQNREPPAQVGTTTCWSPFYRLTFSKPKNLEPKTLNLKPYTLKFTCLPLFQNDKLILGAVAWFKVGRKPEMSDRTHLERGAEMGPVWPTFSTKSMISETNLGSPADCLEILEFLEEVGKLNFFNRFQKKKRKKTCGKVGTANFSDTSE